MLSLLYCIYNRRTFTNHKQRTRMKLLLHIIIKSIVLTAIGVACYYIYTGLMA